MLNGLLFAVLFVGTCACSNKTEDEQLPPEVFFQLPEKDNFKVSSDGLYFAYQVRTTTGNRLYTQKIGDRETNLVVECKNQHPFDYYWVNDHRILYFKKDDSLQSIYPCVLDVYGNNENTFVKERGAKSVMLNEHCENPSQIIIGTIYPSQKIPDVWRLNVDNGERTWVAKAPENAKEWICDHQGQVRLVVCIEDDGLSRVIKYRNNEYYAFRDLLKVSPNDIFIPQVFDYENKNFYALSNRNRDKVAVVKYNIESGTEEVIYENKKQDVSCLNFSDFRKEISSTTIEVPILHRISLTNESSRLENRIASHLKDLKFHIVSKSEDETKLILEAFSDRVQKTIYLYDASANTLETLYTTSDNLPKEQLSKMQQLSFTARDKQEIDAFLTFPAGYTLETARRLPLLCIVHNGPWAHDVWGYHPEVQMWVDRGYVVLQMNYRGSTGYGKAFMRTSFNQWGAKMQEDWVDGIDWLVAKGTIDKNSIAIYGVGYGGYVAMEALIQTPGRFACGIAQNGFTNLFPVVNDVPMNADTLRTLLYNCIGNPEIDSLRFVKRSPVFQAEKIQQPLLFGLDANDARISKTEVEEILNNLKQRNIQGVFIDKTSDKKGFLSSENQLEFYKQMEVFLTEHLPLAGK